MRGNWSHKYDTILFQLYAQIIAAKDVSGGLDALQLDRTCGLLTNGRKWIIMGEKDGVAYIAPYVLDGNEHAVAAVVALFLGAMTPSRQSEHAESGGDKPPAKKRKGAKRVIRSLLDDMVPRAAAPSSRLLSGRGADPLSAFTVEDPPKLTFRLWSKFRPSVVFIYRSTDKQYALNHVECVKMSSRVGELDGYAATDEILCEAKALEHLEASAPALSGVLLPPYLGLWTSAGDRTLFGLITTWFGEPVEPCSLEYLHRFAFSSYFTNPDAQP
ncbi:uncharacterized protein JCM10292_006689 [Rhodotorula paludigena]|uniref:uncharacterized protein n=1 Tax=Rhodotorula paludigena TaxID=86838 RepID=UPI00317035D1